MATTVAVLPTIVGQHAVATLRRAPTNRVVRIDVVAQVLHAGVAQVLQDRVTAQGLHV